MINILHSNSYWKKTNSVSIYNRNLQVLATEMFKVNMNLSPDSMNIFLKRTNPYTIGRNDTFSIWQVSSAYHGTEMKLSENLEIFKKE